jgi:hypothetical protein
VKSQSAALDAFCVAASNPDKRSNVVAIQGSHHCDVWADMSVRVRAKKGFEAVAERIEDILVLDFLRIDVYTVISAARMALVIPGASEPRSPGPMRA